MKIERSRTVSGALLALLLAFSHTPLASASIGTDARAILSGRTLGILAAGAAASALSLRFEDPRQQAALFETGSFDGPSDFGNSYGSGITLAAFSGLMLGAGHLSDDEGLKRTGGEMARSLLYTSLTVTAMKAAFGRKRPNGGSWSFPSGHTATAFSVAPVLARRFGTRAAIPAYLLGAATAIGRMEDRKHYLSDVIFGAAVGISIGLAVSGDDAKPASLRFEPSLDGAALSYRF